jgi:ribose transport system permease protein
VSVPVAGMLRRGGQQVSLLMVVAATCLVFASLSDRFLDTENLLNILVQSAATTVAAVGMTFVIVTRGIDLSVGSIANCALGTAVLLTGTEGGSALTAVTSYGAYPVALAVGLALGFLNGLIITRLKVSPLIATLGTLTAYRGLGLHLTAAASIAVRGAILAFPQGAFLGVAYPIWAAFAIALLGWLVLSNTVFGRQLLALGGAPRSARESGLDTVRLLLAVYTLSGLCAAVAGLIIVGRVGIIDTTLGFNFEFTVITAVVLGGTSLFGGRGTILGTVLGALLLSTVDNGLNLIGANPFIYEVVRGLILITAVSLDAYVNRRNTQVTAVEQS